MIQKVLIFILVIGILLSGCAALPGGAQQYTATFLDLFDTVTTVTGRASSEEAFNQTSQAIHDALLEYHRLFDIYNDYDGIHNLKTVNDAAGIAPVKVDSRIIQLLKFCKEVLAATDGKVNVAMGSVLKLWHDARTAGLDDPANAKLPSREALEEASLHTGLDAVIIDEYASTVYISDPLTRLDVGAVAKGWAAQQVAQAAPEGILISVGGNICATGPKDEAGTAWVVGIQDPENSDEFLHTLRLKEGSAVTSGDYQRTYSVDGVDYHHIIDPDTLYPATYWRSVTIVCADSGLADMLSTALFILPLDEGQSLLAQYEAEAMWVSADSQTFYSAGFEALIQS